MGGGTGMGFGDSEKNKKKSSLSLKSKVSENSEFDKGMFYPSTKILFITGALYISGVLFNGLNFEYDNSTEIRDLREEAKTKTHRVETLREFLPYTNDRGYYKYNFEKVQLIESLDSLDKLIAKKEIAQKPFDIWKSWGVCLSK